MAELIKTKTQTTLDFGATLHLNEVELRALDALAGYGTDPFLKAFYKKMGKYYLHPHENGIVSLFKTIKKEIPQHLNRIDNIRKAINEANVN